MNWTQRRRTCSTIYTLPENPYQVIWEHQENLITYKGKKYPTVELAKEQAEKDVS